MFCSNCGKEVKDGDAFCPGCGKKQVKTYKEVFVRNGLAEKDFIDNINKWFQYHPKAANIKCKFGLDTAIGMFANKYVLNQFVIEYELYENENTMQYGLTREENTTFVKKDINGFIGDWQVSHPNAKIVNWQGGTHQRGQTSSLMLGGVGAVNRMNVYILFKFPRPNAAAPTVAVNNYHVVPESNEEGAKAFGLGGEENVWHNLKTMLGCDVYRNVKIRNGDTASEIDAVVVSESKGIFLLEIKSVGGISDAVGNKIIAHNQLREDPSNQIYRHEADFIKYFDDVNISGKLKNVLVFSWPYGDTRRQLAINTFPKTEYGIITVEQLIAYFRAQPDAPLTQQERVQISSKLKVCSGESNVK